MHTTMIRHLITAVFALLVGVSCSDEYEKFTDEKDASSQSMISFSDCQTDATLRSGGDITSDNFSAMRVFAYNTGQSNFDASAQPNFMYNQSVTKSNSVWTYSPAKYWLHEDEHISFFALSHEPTAANGITDTVFTGYPSFTVTPSANPINQKDILVASKLNHTKDAGDVKFTFNHAMTKINFSAKYSGGTMPAGGYIKIKYLFLMQIAGSGKLRFTDTGFSWTTGSGLTNYYLSKDNGDLSDNPLSTTDTPLSTAAGTLMLVPQTASKARIQIIAAFYNGTVEKEYEITATLPAATTWKAGEQITYNLEINLDKGYMNLTPTTTIMTYSYTGGVQTFSAPDDGYYQLEAWGAKGGTQYSTGGWVGWALGNGGYVKGTLYLKRSQKIHVYVGESKSGNGSGNGNEKVSDSWNGGGGCIEDSHSGTGGGATDFRLKDGEWSSPQGLNSRIMVAGGGGGCGNRYFKDNTIPSMVDNKGHAGGLNGYNSKKENSASMGGTQTEGGSSYAPSGALPGEYGPGAKSGTFGAGGFSGRDNYCGGGGGGYYGGAGNGYIYGGQGSGGSSFISGMTGCIAINPSSTSEPRTPDSGQGVLKTMLNYSDATFGASLTWPDGAEIIFTNCSMIDGDSDDAGNGKGYEWNTGEKGASVTLPANPAGDGKGYARITRLN